MSELKTLLGVNHFSRLATLALKMINELEQEDMLEGLCINHVLDSRDAIDVVMKFDKKDPTRWGWYIYTGKTTTASNYLIFITRDKKHLCIIHNYDINGPRQITKDDLGGWDYLRMKIKMWSKIRKMPEIVNEEA